MAFDPKKWLMEDMGFSEADATEIAGKFAGDRAGKLEVSVVGASERAAIAKARADLEAGQAALKTANDRLNAELAEWATLTTAEKARATELQDALDKSQQQVLALTQNVQRLADKAGIDPATILKTEAPVTDTKKPEAPPIDVSKFVPVDAYQQLARFQLELPAALQYIADEHRALFGKSLDTRTIVAEIQKRAGQKDAVIDPVRIWEEQHGVSARREALAKERHDAEIAAAESRGEERARSSMAVPGASPSRSVRPSPVLGHRNDQGQFVGRQSVLQRPQAQTAVMSAAQALRSGKYRQTEKATA